MTYITVRLLECWLPLAQDANQLYGWGYDAPALQRLIFAAAPSLEGTVSKLEGRAVLWHYHLMQLQEWGWATGSGGSNEAPG